MPFAAAVPRYIDGSGAVTVDDAILLLQALSGQTHAGLNSRADADVNGNGKSSLSEVIHIIQKATGVR